MFGKPKKHKEVSTPEERLKAHANMLKRYPQMGTEGWGQPTRKRAAKVAAAPSNRARAVEMRLKDAGLSDADLKQLKG